MLQQTRVATVVPRYERWVERFPTIEAVAQATEGEVLDEWAGLGYYSRARRLHEAAKQIVANGWPKTAAEWRRVPGVGRYTAGALASIIGGEDTPVVDGNVVRVYARLAADSAPLPEPRAWQWAESGLPRGRAESWNQALMELGATICTPRNPKCRECPVSRECLARLHGDPLAFPARSPRQAQIMLDATVTAHVDDGHVGLRRVPEGNWWQGLREIPTEFEATERLGQAIGTVTHTVTKHRIVAEVRIAYGTSDNLEWHPLADDPSGVSALSRKAIHLVRGYLASETAPGNVADKGATRA